jgi:hypothetical protein
MRPKVYIVNTDKTINIIMKILIIALPRTASKFLQINLNFYLKKMHGESFDHPVAKYIGAGELLYVKNTDQLGKLKSIHNKLFFDNIEVDVMEELYNRIDILTSGIPVVTKYMPIQFLPDQEIDILNYMIGKFDKIYILNRENYIDHMHSWCISYLLKSWRTDDLQKELIQKSLQQKIQIDYSVKSIFDNMVKNYNFVLSNIDKTNSINLEFNDIIKINSSKNMCDLLKIEYIDFYFYDKMTEYGDYKKDMILN